MISGVFFPSHSQFLFVLHSCFLFLLCVCHSCKDIVLFKVLFSFPNRHMQMPWTLGVMTASVNVFVYRKKYISINYCIFFFFWVMPNCNMFNASFALLLCSEYFLYIQIKTLLNSLKKKKGKGIGRHQKWSKVSQPLLSHINLIEELYTIEWSCFIFKVSVLCNWQQWNEDVTWIERITFVWR